MRALGLTLKKISVISALMAVSSVAMASQEMQRAEQYLNAGNSLQASQRFYDIYKNPKYRSEHPVALYNLGRALSKMGLNQSAIYYLGAIPKLNRGQVNNALEVLYEIGFEIGDQDTLNYALSKIDLKKFPKKKQDMLYYRLGEVYLDKRDYRKAISAFSKIPSNSKLYAKAQYNRGLAFAEQGDAKASASSFTKAVNARRNDGVKDVQRVGALMGRARAYYQLGEWNKSIAAYRMIPRDSYFWHDSIFESSWAMLRSGRFRSAMSNFQSLHSKFYDDRYQPESLILRSIVYLYICRYDEVNKVLSTYDRTYGQLLNEVKAYIKDQKAKTENLNQMNRMFADISKGQAIKASYNGAPGLALRYISKKADFAKDYEYLKNLYKERAKIRSLPRAWTKSNMGQQLEKNLSKRIDRLEVSLSNYVTDSMRLIGKELVGLNDQKEFIKYEVLNAQTESARKKMSGNDAPEDSVEGKNSRDYYIKNGYEYWPFQGEYWLDEIGNYHYVGTSQCQ